MDRKLRAFVIFVGALLTTLAASFTPWFTLTYTSAANHPVNGYDPTAVSHFSFNALFMLPYFNDIGSAKGLYIYIGLTIVIALLAWIPLPFVEGFIKFLNVFDALAFFVTLVINLFNRAILGSMSPSFLLQFYGTTDRKYIDATTTLTIGWGGLLLTILGLVILSVAVNTPGDDGNSVASFERGRIAFLFTGAVVIVTIIVCCTGGANVSKLLGGYQATIGDQIYWTISATSGWQDTHVYAYKGNQVCVIYLSGQWTTNNGVVALSDANGKPTKAPTSLSKQPNEPVPGVSSQAMVAKMNNGKPFLVGDVIGYDTAADGEIYLRINEQDSALQNNRGSVYVFVFTEPDPLVGSPQSECEGLIPQLK